MSPITCECGRVLHINHRDPELRFVRCTCGAAYDRTGKPITPRPKPRGIHYPKVRGWFSGKAKP